jgi:hypothetical protein
VHRGVGAEALAVVVALRVAVAVAAAGLQVAVAVAVAAGLRVDEAVAVAVAAGLRVDGHRVRGRQVAGRSGQVSRLVGRVVVQEVAARGARGSARLS